MLFRVLQGGKEKLPNWKYNVILVLALYHLLDHLSSIQNDPLCSYVSLFVNIWELVDLQ